MVTDGTALPMAVEVTAGQVHESTRFESVMKAAPILRCRKRRRKRPKGLAGDKGYSYSRIRAWLRRHKIKAIIPQREDQRERGELAFDTDTYRRRSIIENCVGWLKECRRIGTRFEKLAVNFLGMMKLAIIQRYLRVLFSDRA